MKIKSLLLSFIMFFAANINSAEQPQWFYDAIKGNSPNQLAYFITTNSCPFTVFSVIDSVPEKKNISFMGSMFGNKKDDPTSNYEGQNIKRDPNGEPILYRGQVQVINKVISENPKVVNKVISENLEHDGRQIKRDANGKPLLYRGQVQPL